MNRNWCAKCEAFRLPNMRGKCLWCNGPLGEQSAEVRERLLNDTSRFRLLCRDGRVLIQPRGSSKKEEWKAGCDFVRSEIAEKDVYRVLQIGEPYVSVESVVDAFRARITWLREGCDIELEDTAESLRETGRGDILLETRIQAAKRRMLNAIEEELDQVLIALHEGREESLLAQTKRDSEEVRTEDNRARRFVRDE